MTVSVHCHNDLGLATANSLAAVRAGATQIECAVNGIGERAGNASLEEVVMALATRGAYFGATTGIVTEEIARSSRMVSNLTGYVIQPNKAIVGRNAFAHESGIHQAGLLSESSTFEIMKPADVGLTDSDLVLGKHSGRHALRARLEELGYRLTDAELDEAFHRFKDLADKKKDVTALDLEALVGEEIRERQDRFTLLSYVTQAGSSITPTTQVEVEVRGRRRRGKSFSNGTVEVGLQGDRQRRGHEGQPGRLSGAGGHGRQGRPGRGQAGGRGRRPAVPRAGGQFRRDGVLGEGVRTGHEQRRGGEGKRVMGHTIVEKILARAAGREAVSPGDIVEAAGRSGARQRRHGADRHRRVREGRLHPGLRPGEDRPRARPLHAQQGHQGGGPEQAHARVRPAAPASSTTGRSGASASSTCCCPSRG